MHKNLNRIPTLEMAQADWLKHRRNSIGGSDASAILGLNDWSSPYRVWADKTGRLPDTPDNEAMRQGRDLEEYVAQRWSEATGNKVRRLNAILQNPTYPFAHANIDRLVVGEDAGLECKTTSILNMKNFQNGEFPANYYVQCVHYMAVTGAQRWYLAVLVLNKGFYSFTIERDEDEIKALMEQEAEFWNYVKTNEPPPVDGSEVTTETLRTIYPGESGGAIELFGRESLLEEYYRQKSIEENAKTKIEEIKQVIMSDMGDNDTALCADHKITWKPQSRRTFDAKRFAADHPQIKLDGYYNVSSSRPFIIKEIVKNA